MTVQWKYWRVCIAAILVILMAGMSVSAAGEGKKLVPGIANSICYGGSRSDIPYSFQQTLDGGYIIAGGTTSDDYDVTGFKGTNDIWVVKLNPDLTLDWKKCYGGSGQDNNAFSICQTTDGGYIFSALVWSSDGDIHDYIGGGDIWVVKLNATGGIMWSRCLGGIGTDQGNSVLQTRDGGYIIAGWTISGNSGNVSGWLGLADAWIVKLNPAGDIQWQKCLGGSDIDLAQSIQQTSDGGFILVGKTYSNDKFVSGNHNATGSTSDIWVAKLSEDGLLQWQKCLGGTGDDDSYSIRQTSEGGYIVIGETYSDNGDVSGFNGFSDIWVVKLDPFGTIEWQRCLGGSDMDWGTSIEQTSDGGYILASATRSSDGLISGNHGYRENWVVKLDALGWPVWQKCLGGSDDEGAYPNIQQTPDGSFILVTSTKSTDYDVTDHKPGASNNDFWVVKLFGPPVVNGIAPSRVPTGTATTLVLTGENLIQNWVTPTVTFYKPGTEITVPVGVFQMDGTRITCDVTQTTFLSPGVYSIRVTTDDNQYVTLTNAFTVTCGPAPTISSISPASGIQGAVLNPVVIKGTKYWTAGGVTAYLNRTGQPNISIAITSHSGTQLVGNCIVPAGAATGKWNLVVRNPDGQVAVKKDAFTVTLRTFKPPRVSAVTPRTVTTGSTVFINGIAGSFFNASATVAMTGPRGVSIPVSNVTVQSDTKITCDANLTSIAKGYATVTVTNPDGKKSTRARAFLIK